MMTGQTALHEKFERMLADFEKKEAAFLFNFGYQGIFSTIDSLVGRHDVIVYDAECHACLLDGIRLHIGDKFKFRHNDAKDCDRVLARATKVAEESGGGILVITEGVFGMTGALGILDQIVALKQKYNFRFMIDDAHGFGVMGPHGRGTSEHFGVMDGVDLYIGAYAKSMATIGGFVASDKDIIDYLRYNMRSQIYAKSLPMPIVEGCIKRLQIIDSPEGDERRAHLWKVTRRPWSRRRTSSWTCGRTTASSARWSSIRSSRWAWSSSASSRRRPIRWRTSSGPSPPSRKSRSGWTAANTTSPFPTSPCTSRWRPSGLPALPPASGKPARTAGPKAGRGS